VNNWKYVNFVQFIIIEKKAEKFLNKLDNSIRVEFDRLIMNTLAENPFPINRKHILSSKGNALLCELDYKKWRIYYEYKDSTIIIAGIMYDGIVSILEGTSNDKSGSRNNWSNQREEIKKLKKEFKHKHK
jgi:mRNA-degrading endonuclease RelE of RelBE toxin-antitoxin system